MVEGAPRALEGGRAEVALASALVEGPAELLAPPAGERLVLELRTRPRGKR